MQRRTLRKIWNDEVVFVGIRYFRYFFLTLIAALGALLFWLGPKPADANHNANGLVAYYAAEGDVSDGSGHGFSGVLQPGASIVNDPVRGQVFSFSGATNSYVSVADAPLLRLGTQQTVSAWFKWSGGGTDWERIVGKGDSANRNYGLWIHPNKLILFQIYGPSGTCQIYVRVGLNSNWHHLAGTYDGSKITLYYDGVSQAQRPCGMAPPTGNHPLTIGYAGFSQPFPGRVDDVRLYSRALAAAEVAELAVGAGLSDPDPFSPKAVRLQQ